MGYMTVWIIEISKFFCIFIDGETAIRHNRNQFLCWENDLYMYADLRFLWTMKRGTNAPLTKDVCRLLLTDNTWNCLFCDRTYTERSHNVSEWIGFAKYVHARQHKHTIPDIIVGDTVLILINRKHFQNIMFHYALLFLRGWTVLNSQGLLCSKITARDNPFIRHATLKALSQNYRQSCDQTQLQ